MLQAGRASAARAVRGGDSERPKPGGRDDPGEGPGPVCGSALAQKKSEKKLIEPGLSCVRWTNHSCRMIGDPPPPFPPPPLLLKCTPAPDLRLRLLVACRVIR